MKAKCELCADGMEDRISVTDINGQEILRLRGATPREKEFAQAVNLIFRQLGESLGELSENPS